MDSFVRRFIRASLAWLGLGTVLGLALVTHPAWIIYRPAHVHLNLVGFVMMMIFGVAYHVMPRFAGHPLHSPPLATLNWWVANLGLAGMTSGFVLRPHAALGTHLLVAGGILETAAAWIFIWNIWHTLRAPPAVSRPVPAARGLPVLNG
jgi:cytochrome c oxidase cbb3-type subunit 1